jgi:hypothetical protein
MVVAEWDGWLKWDGTIEVLPSFESRRQSIASSFNESELSGMDLTRNSESVICEDVLEADGMFELDEPNISLPSPFQFSKQSDDNRSTNLRGQSIGNPGRPLHAYSTLSAVEADHIMAGTTSTCKQDNSVLKSVKARGRPLGIKRKFSTTKEDQIDMCKYQKQSHNIVEKRYRINLNDKIDTLRRSIPKFQDMSSRIMEGDEGEASHEPGSPLAYKPGKATILTGAVEYILQLEKNTKRLGAETAALKIRLAAFEELAMAGSIFLGEGTCPDTPLSEFLEGNQADPHFLVRVYKLNSSLDFEPAPATRAMSTGANSSRYCLKKRGGRALTTIVS